MESSSNASTSLPTPAMNENKKLIELKNNKVVLKQKPMPLDKLSETLQEIVQFRAMLEARISNGEGPLTSIPTTLQPVIVKLAFESDKTLATISKNIRQELLPIGVDESTASPAADIFPVSAVEAVIKATMTRNNYGLDAPPGLAKAPAALLVWRWDISDTYINWLPPSVHAKAVTRLNERQEAKQALADIILALSPPERDTLFGVKSAATDFPMKSNVVNDAPHGTHAAEEEHKSRNPAGRSRKDKAPDLKEIERQERKAAKLDKEKKLKAAEDKSRSLMANFFSKPKAAKATPATPPKPNNSSTQSDYQRTFKRFILKKGATLAPSNVFRERRKYSASGSGTHDDLIILEDDAADKEETFVPLGRNWGLEDLRRRPRRRQSGAAFESVRDIVTQLSEAEVTGETSLVRELLAKLADRSIVPAKVLIFHQDSRPGYFGTRTRTSATIKPRRPFAKDVLELDYGYDSGEEWEPETIGDGDDVLEDNEEDIDGDDQDSDADSWLVDDDEEGVDGMVADDDMGPDIPRPVPMKRKAGDGDRNAFKKRKVVVPLVPFAKGPYWELAIGECEYPPFNGYRIKLLNGSSLPIDPFKDVMGPSAPTKKGPSQRAQEPIFAVPPVPVRDQAPPVQSTANDLAPAVSKKPAVAKTPFPEAYLPTLIEKLDSLQTGNLTFLVEAIHHELRQHKVKKNAIEAKIKELGEKCKETKQWKLKSEFSGIAQQMMAV